MRRFFCAWNKQTHHSIDGAPAAGNPASRIAMKFTAFLTLFFTILSIPMRLPAAVVSGRVELGEDERRPSGMRYARGAREQPGDPPDRVAVVYLENPAISGDPLQEPLELGQTNIQFDRYVLPVVVGQKIVFPNNDPVFHSVFSYSKAKSFDLGRYHKGDEPGEVIFDQPGLVMVHCEVHPHMRAYILVLKTPLFVETDPDGNYRLENVPPGDHTINAWVGPNTLHSRKISVSEGDDNTINLPARNQ